MTTLYHSPPGRQTRLAGPTTPKVQRLPSITHPRFSLIRFRSPLLTEYLFLWVLRCFTSPRSLTLPYTFRQELPAHTKAASRVSPFGNPRITARLSTPRGLSQITTSFFGSRCQGIHRLLFKTCKHYKITQHHTHPNRMTVALDHKNN